MNKVRVAVVGAGRLGGFHAKKLARMEQVELVALVDPSTTNRERVAAECDATPLAHHRSLLGKIDAAVIASPSVLHHEVALELLEAGIHLLVEKPLCTTTGPADELVAAAASRNLVLQVGHVERFNPAFAAAASAARDPKYIEAVRASGFAFRSMDIGVVLDLMIHDIDLVLSMVRSKLRRIDALGLSVLGGHEDVANARLEFESGCVATLSASRVSYEAMRRMQIWAPRAYANIDFTARTTTLVRPSESLLRREFHADQLQGEELDHYRKHLLEEHLPREQNCYDEIDALALELADFVESILTSREPLVTGEAGRDAVAVAEQILGCIRTHAWDNSATGPKGPAAIPFPRVVPSPHFDLSAVTRPPIKRKAG